VPPVVAFYISGHGFGHASRQIELMRELLAVRPDAQLIVRTSAPAHLFDAIRNVTLESVDTDTGLTQTDSLQFDEEQSAREAARFYAGFDARVDVEVERLQRAHADVVVGDIPPLAFAASHRAGIPSAAVGNFTWDWIYSIYPAFERLAPAVLPAIRNAYALATRALRLPLHGGFAPMAGAIEDVPFIARRSARGREATRHRLGLPSDRPLVLPSFGAYGVALPLDRLRASSRFTLIDPAAPLPADLGYQDLVAAADVVVSKPGYGIVSECVANGTALLYTSRGRFVEYDVFVEAMPRILKCRFLAQPDLLAGHWANAVDAVMRAPAPPESPRVDGAAVAAREILSMAGG